MRTRNFCALSANPINNNKNPIRKSNLQNINKFHLICHILPRGETTREKQLYNMKLNLNFQLYRRMRVIYIVYLWLFAIM